MPEIMIKDQLKKLVEIQKIDEEIYQHNSDLTEKPALIEKLKVQFESKKTHLNELEQKSQDIQLERKDIELTLKTKEEEIAKANTQLSDIKTNKEYQAKITEIEGMKADKSIFEDKILESYDRADEVKGLIDEEKKNVDQEEQHYLEKKKEVEQAVAQIKDRIKVLENQRNQLLPEVDKTVLQRYERILKHKAGLAIVPVQGSACGGCYMNLTPQTLNLIKMSSEIVECDRCSRILYLEEDL